MIHKDYLFPAHIQINISPEKVEIINPGKLLFPKKEFGRTSAYRNPILKDLKIEWSEKWSEKWSELTKRRKQILILIINNPKITRSELSKKLDINPSAIQKHLDLLKEKEIIIREGPDKGGYWKIIQK